MSVLRFFQLDTQRQQFWNKPQLHPWSPSRLKGYVISSSLVEYAKRDDRIAMSYSVPSFPVMTCLPENQLSLRYSQAGDIKAVEVASFFSSQTFLQFTKITTEIKNVVSSKTSTIFKLCLLLRPPPKRVTSLRPLFKRLERLESWSFPAEPLSCMRESSLRLKT